MTHEQIAIIVGTELMPWWPDGLKYEWVGRGHKMCRAWRYNGHAMSPEAAEAMLIGGQAKYLFKNGVLFTPAMFDPSHPTLLGQLECLCLEHHKLFGDQP